jgi:hypothetical protein
MPIALWFGTSASRRHFELKIKPNLTRTSPGDADAAAQLARVLGQVVTIRPLSYRGFRLSVV